MRDIKCKYEFLECKYRTILHGSTIDCTAASACGQTTVKRGRINGAKLICSLFCRTINNLLHSLTYFVSSCGKYVRLVKISSRTERLPV